MTKKSFFLAALCACIVPACKENQDTETQGAFRFSAICHGYKGGGALMAAGDSAGIFAGEPLSVANRKGIMENSGYLVFSPYIQTVEGSADTAAVCAYTPYSSGLSGSRPTFSVREDQSTRKSFDASCLCTAAAKLPAGDNGKATKLQFHPVMSGLSLRVTNLTDSPVISVEVKEMKGSVALDTTDGTVTATGEKSDFLTYADPDSAGVYKLYLAPQEGTVTVTATLENGEEYDFRMTARLVSGEIASNASEPFVIESRIGPVGPEEFTTVTVPGVYLLNDTVLAPILTYTAGEDQCAISGTAASRRFRLQNLPEGWLYGIEISPSQLAEGSGVSVTTEAVNCAELSSGTYSATVVRADSGTAWLACTDAELGFIVRTE